MRSAAGASGRDEIVHAAGKVSEKDIELHKAHGILLVHQAGRGVTGILEEHREEIPVGERTIYSYIGNGYLSAKSLDMRRMVRYKKRKKQREVKVSPVKKVNHHYKDFQKELEDNPGIRVAEMDTVEGVKGGKVLHIQKAEYSKAAHQGCQTQ